MDPIKPTLEDLQQAFAVTGLEPELSDELLIAFAAGRATELERELVETMIDADPTLASLVSVIREELAGSRETLPSRARNESKPAGWRFWLPRVAPLVGLAAACVLLLFSIVDRTRLLDDARSKDRQLAQANTHAAQELKDRVASLQRQLDSSGADRNRLLAELDRAKELLRHGQESPPPSGEVESLVASALTHGLSMPAPVADLTVSRGPADLTVSISPDKTSVRLPVKLSWSGAQGGDYRVEVQKDGQTVWSAQTAHPSASPPGELLKPGETYAWRVASENKRGPWAVFRVSTESETKRADAIDKDRKLGPLEKGIVYADLGLVSEAKAQFKLLHASHPALAERLLKEIERSQAQSQGP